MQEFISNIQTSYESYQSIGKIILLLTGILGLLAVKSTQRIRVIVIYTVIGSLVVLNPFLISREIQLLGEKHFYRLGMILLIPILSAYCISVLYKKLTDKNQRMIAIIGSIILIAASGKLVYTSDSFYRADNPDKVYNLAVDLADCVTGKEQTPTVAISEVQGVFIRQYNPNIRLILAPTITENWAEAEDENTRLMRVMLEVEVPDMKELTLLADKLGCDYLILLEHQTKQDNPANYGFQYIETFEKFVVYENNLGAE
ncbi:hypothetical protein [Lachnotalea glycerini]|uniref:Uncharacterized protein n=1 Tax=Lachnotalea glycerini TaxID=1763509 RepID=A0A371JCY0_9FIRM|nr:hypothetical protein [Lachnotalea glycerini]RDY30546.1 hypothetical protein CG710_014160 [Lachnotalea glycerini]